MYRAITLGTLLLGTLVAQTVEFEVATIKPATPTGDRGTNISTNGDTIILHNATLKFAVQAAYSVPADLVLAGPDWAGTQRFEITGKSAAPVAPEQLLQMLRTLLADRFQLKHHAEKRESTAYNLVQTRGGAKMKPSNPTDGAAPFLTRNPNGTGLTGSKTTMAQLAATLSLPSALGRPVSDKTGLPGAYDFTLGGFSSLTSASDDPRPSFFTALEETLGLKLDPTKALLEVLVIDLASKPSEN